MPETNGAASGQAPRDRGPQLYTVAEACRRLSIGQTKLYELLTPGEGTPPEIRSVKIGDRRLIPARELERYIDRLLLRAARKESAS